MSPIKWKQHYWHTVSCARERINEIVRRAQGAKNVLDAGCNEGFLSQALKESGLKVTSIDIEDKEILKAKEIFGIDAVKADINKLPFSDGEFDLVIGGEVLEHLVNPGKGLSELFRVSSDRVIISLPIGEYWLGCSEHLWQIDTTVIEHDQGIKEELIKKILVMEFKKR
ncbi:MAG: class I SAM-dependent methyltransferase [Candidatus Omnitrophica bacterium]|nr:class I SAM-dependent methyltransferase [Candidatus Omnitrophota bacterium]